MFKLLLFKLLFIFFIETCTLTFADKIKNLTTIEGIRENQLIGYGLVVGLNGTGDHITQVPFTMQTLNNMLSQLGIKSSISNNNIQLKNIASVIVTAKLPPFGLQGEKIDVSVSSIGNSSSLEGGILLMTPLKGIDNQIYAIAQGNLSIYKPINIKYTKNIKYKNTNQLNSGYIHYGAIIEREVKNNFNNSKIIKLQLYKEDFTLSKLISEKINFYYKNLASAINGKSIIINTTSFNNNEKVNIISNIQNIDIPTSQLESKIIVNSNIGSIVINKEIKLNACSITYKNFSIFIDGPKKKYFFQSIDPYTKLLKYTTQHPKDAITLAQIIHTLNLFKITPVELISILQSMKTANCLSTKVEILS